MTSDRLTAPRAAFRLTKIVEAYSAAHQLDRFPVDVKRLALNAHEVFRWRDPICKIEAASIEGFEGCLVPNDDRSQWLILYSDQVRSAGRIRFTQAHELGHYLLHRFDQDSFHCTEADMVNWSKEAVGMEGQADEFASYLLMPLDDYRRQIPEEVNLDVFSACAERYGVSLIAAILKWLSDTTEKAVLVYSTDGFMNWAFSSEPAYKAGAFFKTKGRVVPLPVSSLAADSTVSRDCVGRPLSANLWFKHAVEGMHVREMKIVAERLGTVISLLVLPRTADVWPPRE